MDMLVYLLAGLVIGTLLGWFIAKSSKPKLSAGSSEEYIELDKSFTAYRGNQRGKPAKCGKQDEWPGQ